MRLGQLLADLHELGSDQPQAAVFEAGDYFPDQSTLHAIRLDKYESTFHFSSMKMVSS